jgi:hypothetical protein
MFLPEYSTGENFFNERSPSVLAIPDVPEVQPTVTAVPPVIPADPVNVDGLRPVDNLSVDNEDSTPEATPNIFTVSAPALFEEPLGAAPVETAMPAAVSASVPVQAESRTAFAQSYVLYITP